LGVILNYNSQPQGECPMKSLRIMLVAALISLPGMAFGQTTPTDAQKIFAAMKSLEGSWVGPIAIFPAVPREAMATIGDSMRSTLRVVSRGKTIVHEMHGANLPHDPSKYDHPVTMIYLDEQGKLALTHYCDAGNRPRMTARISADGKVIDFDFIDVSGKIDRTGHMQHATFTFVDKDHHIQDWSYKLPNNQIMRAHFELRREPVMASASR
jgi:hypothetical protein